MSDDGTIDGYLPRPESYDALMESLTDAQHLAATQGPDAKILVTAGAGTGKTQLLVARLATLVREWDVNAGQELLVLSFTRAAVRAVKERLSIAGEATRYVSIATFDSYATRLLSLVRPTGAWQEGSYEDRIAAAIEMIRAGEADAHISQIRHLCVDETQDLVGLRADLVLALLDAIRGGFTLLGDPAQSIYNWQLEDDDARRDGSTVLYRWVRRHFAEDLIEVTLEENFRAETEAARAALWAGTELNADAPDYEAIWDRLHDGLAAMPSLGKAGRAADALLEMERSSTAVLCRTNGETLKFSRLLDGAGVPHRIQRRFSDRAVAPWLAKSLGASPTRTIGRAAFERSLEGVNDPSLPDPEHAWRLLRRLVRGARNDALDLAIVAERVRSGYVPDELNWTPPSWLVVSTIHRAKGLEFDRVVILDGRPAPDDENGFELAEETRTLYVALTRARRDVFHAEHPNTYGFTTSADRWYRQGRQRWQVHDVELRGDDVHWMDPAGGFLIDAHQAADLQRYIGERVRPGDPVALVRKSGSNNNGESRVFYEIQHAGTPVGVTAESFGGALFAILRAHRRQVVWPEEIKNVTVDTVDTVAGTEAAGRRAGLGPSGLWLRVRIAGLGYLDF